MRWWTIFCAALANTWANQAAQACSDCEYEQCLYSYCACLPKSGCIGKQLTSVLVDTLTTPPRLVVTTADQAVRDVAKTIHKAFDDTLRTVNVAGKDVERNLNRAGIDLERETQRFGLETESAGRAIAKAVESNVTGRLTEYDRAIQRTRQGKFIDAMWHAALSPVVVAEASASDAILESSYLRAIGQVAATTYGGPEGAAAYSAWLTFKETGDPSLALRVGIITGASAWANVRASGISDVGRRAVVTAAVGGTVVAAAGGNQEAVKTAFLQAGAMVVVQDGYKTYTTHKMNPSASADIPAYCIAAGEKNCTTLPESAVISKDRAGNITGVNMREVDPSVPAVGLKSHSALFNESNPVMVSVSKIPGMQAMAIFHDTWATDWKMDSFATASSIIPAIVVTYIGLGAPYYETVRETAVDSALRGSGSFAANSKIADAFYITPIESFIEFDEVGKIRTQVVHQRRGAGIPLWCGGPGSKFLFEERKRFGDVSISEMRCFKNTGRGIIADRPQQKDYAARIIVVRGTQEETVCESLFDRSACDGIAAAQVEKLANDNTVWYRAAGRAGN